ncbi:nucleoside diphosphate-linked moiety X motif 8 isoform X1 [Protopterus annectens]|uniref:nucleoside diphosphate-linked moiety X motif 8 isoform X1 n=1 Tax=Protopterus annectens TaxID=7888 RepID=UPI001CF9690D|nr:nucleoside diphosphate-linked moiety X motif 8 isoform X1 [Protopterus annectens]XP_043940070.1 nucleoside diphosphate-linked moiety X motif 8 isoform X1 [Protopterus annectens]XP_043940071.1 nucleoside diphosphate-linked moiety X motif 8 isoform X1 [Protopterus annectens]XP_043940072.1 nucleoside diphosphate-linked moiety X motif 8 isoform X1 [Protopterus annectens]
MYPRLWQTFMRLRYQLFQVRSCMCLTKCSDVAVIQNCLSKENELRCRQQLQRHSAAYASKKPAAAILVSLCTAKGEPAFLFTLRSSKLKGKHKGDVSFPGGKVDPSDDSIVHTAVREAQEELGISVTEENIWGVMRPLFDGSGMMIAPVLANLGSVESLKICANKEEVEEIFIIPIHHACAVQNRGYTHFRLRGQYYYTLPVFLNAQYKVWGLTAVASDTTLALLLPGIYISMMHIVHQH